LNPGLGEIDNDYKDYLKKGEISLYLIEGELTRSAKLVWWSNVVRIQECAV